MNALAGDAPEDSADKATSEVLERWNLDVIKHYLKRIWAAMQGERGPKDFDAKEDELDVDRIIRLAAERAARQAINIKTYNEGGEGGGSASWQKWMLGIAGVLAATGVISLVGMYGRLSAIEANQINQKTEISELKGDVKQLLMRPR